MWWDEFQGGNGAIFTSIDGQGSSYPIVECDNASRVIKYVGILGYRYKNWDLVDMHIHDINVKADLNAEDPNVPELGEPVKSDGTAIGYTPSVSAVSFIDTLASAMLTEASTWWTGPWPVLHVQLSRTTENGGMVSIQVGVDILGATSLEEFTYETPSDDQMSDSQFEALMESNWEDFYAAAFPVELVLYGAAEGVAIAMDVLLFFMSKVPTPEQLAAYTALMALWCGLIAAFIYAVWDGVNTGRLSYGEAFGLLTITGLVTCGQDLIPALSAAKFIREIWYMRGLSHGVGFRVKWCVGLYVFSAFVRVVFGLMMLLLALWVFELQISSMNMT